jgi:hypothetical protein
MDEEMLKYKSLRHQGMSIQGTLSVISGHTSIVNLKTTNDIRSTLLFPHLKQVIRRNQIDNLKLLM